MVITNSVVKEHLVITNRFIGQIGYIITQINPVITNPNYITNKYGRSRAVRFTEMTVIPKNHLIYEIKGLQDGTEIKF